MKYIKKFIKYNEDISDYTLKKNNSEYDHYFNQGKEDYSKVAWGTESNQLKNYKLVTNYIDNNDSLLDFGCGLGNFLDYLQKINISISDYLGVDINNNYIKNAVKKYPNNKFNLIKSANDIKGNWDVVCAIGVFTWYIEKEEFIDTIRKLHSLCNKHILITLLNDSSEETPYTMSNYSIDDEDDFWTSEYKYYDEELFYELFPEFSSKMTFEYAETTILVKIEK